MLAAFLALLAISVSTVPAEVANPVLLFHGLNDDYKTLGKLVGRIAEDFPGTYTHSIQVATLYIQVDSLTVTSWLWNVGVLLAKLFVD